MLKHFKKPSTTDVNFLLIYIVDNNVIMQFDSKFLFS